MTSRTLKRVLRTAVLSTSAAMSLLVAGPASAGVPEGWSDPEPVPLLQALVIFVGIPLLMILLIAAAVYLPAMTRGERVAPGAAPVANQWFGGPREGTRELESGGDEDAREIETGGAGGRW